jgi:hypothetical protein
MNFRWLWRKRTKKESDSMQHDKDQDARMEATLKASEETEKLISRVHQLAPAVEAHTAVSRRLRRDNGFAYLMYNEAFRGKE